jgi:hypothetical protein
VLSLQPVRDKKSVYRLNLRENL